MLIDYSKTYTAEASLDIKDAGNCAIEGINDDGLYFYLVIVTVRGLSTVATCGPLIPDINDLPNGYTAELYNIKYDGKKLASVISQWLNSKKPGKSKPISLAKLINIADALNQFKNINEFFYQNDDLAAKIAEEGIENG